MKKMIVLFLTLAAVSLACLQTAEPFVTYPAETVTIAPAITMHDVVGIEPEIVITATTFPRTCARVTAERSLHVRQGPSENDIVLAWLMNGEVVHVVGDIDSAWWQISRGELTGYVKAKFLVLSQCWDDD